MKDFRFSSEIFIKKSCTQIKKFWMYKIIYLPLTLFNRPINFFKSYHNLNIEYKIRRNNCSTFNF